MTTLQIVIPVTVMAVIGLSLWLASWPRKPKPRTYEDTVMEELICFLSEPEEYWSGEMEWNGTTYAEHRKHMGLGITLIITPDSIRVDPMRIKVSSEWEGRIREGIRRSRLNDIHRRTRKTPLI